MPIFSLSSTYKSKYSLQKNVKTPVPICYTELKSGKKRLYPRRGPPGLRLFYFPDEAISMKNTKLAGDLAQIAFKYRAMELGLIVSEPYGDNTRYDCIVDNRTTLSRIQVKSCGVVHDCHRYDVNIGRHTAQGVVPYLPSEVDFIAVSLVPEHRWFIFPIATLGARISLKRYLKDDPKDGKYLQFEDAWPSLLGHLATTASPNLLAK